MRGKLTVLGIIDSKQRITPAHAGKTAGSWLSADERADHPRACGENKGEKDMQELKIGSPPRMRGKLLLMS